MCKPRHTHREWLRFLKLLEAETPAELPLHVIADNYATHKHPKVQRWLRRHPRVQMHFMPTGASWLNMVERFLRDLSVKRMRRGAFHNVRELIAVIQSYIASNNQNPKLFTWTAKASDILEKVKRSQATLQKLQSVRRTTLGLRRCSLFKLGRRYAVLLHLDIQGFVVDLEVSRRSRLVSPRDIQRLANRLDLRIGHGCINNLLQRPAVERSMTGAPCGRRNVGC